MFDKEKENRILSWILSDQYIFSSCVNILKPYYFRDENREIIQFVIDYYNKTQKIPHKELIKINLSNIKNIDDFFQNFDFKEEDQKSCLDTIENFCKVSETAKFILETAKHIEKTSEVDETILKKIEDIVSLSIDTDIGLDYSKDPEERIKKFSQQIKTFPTFIPELDKKLGGGFRKGELNIFAGSTGTGKSLFLQNISANWFRNGKNVIYYTLELSEELVANRIDALLVKTSTQYILKNPDESPIMIKNSLKNCKGKLFIKYLESGSTINDILSHLKNFQKQTRLEKIDAIIIDYMDLMRPASVNINMSDLFVKDKYVSEEIRRFAAKLDILCVTASQLNREAISDDDIALNHVAGGISKANTADVFIGIKKLMEKYKLFFLKTRNNDAVGSIIDVPFNPITLTIGSENNSSTLNNIKTNRNEEKNGKEENEKSELEILLEKSKNKKSPSELKRKNKKKDEDNSIIEKNTDEEDKSESVFEENNTSDKEEKIEFYMNRDNDWNFEKETDVETLTNMVFEKLKPEDAISIETIIDCLEKE